MTIYQLTFGANGKVVSRWLVSYHVDETGTLKGVDVRGKERVVGRAMPYSLAERDELPPDIDCDEELLETYDKAENAVGKS